MRDTGINQGKKVESYIYIIIFFKEKTLSSRHLHINRLWKDDFISLPLLYNFEEPLKAYQLIKRYEQVITFPNGLE